MIRGEWNKSKESNYKDKKKQCYVSNTKKDGRIHLLRAWSKEENLRSPRKESLGFSNVERVLYLSFVLRPVHVLRKEKKKMGKGVGSRHTYRQGVDIG